MSEQMMNILASKFGIASKHVILKAEEIKRLVDLQARSCYAFNVTDICHSVICLDLAASNAHLPFNKDLAVRLSGMRKNMYLTTLQTYSKLLGNNMRDRISVSDVASKFGCTKVTDLAQCILNSYERSVKSRLSATNMEAFDLSQVKYSSTAVYVACKHMKIKIEKLSLMDFAGLNRAAFNKLCVELGKHLTYLTTKKKRQNDAKQPKSFLESVQECINGANSSLRTRTQDSSSDESNGYNYEEWKLKILNEDS